MNDRVKYFLYGLLLGRRLEDRDIPKPPEVKGFKLEYYPTGDDAWMMTNLYTGSGLIEMSYDINGTDADTIAIQLNNPLSGGDIQYEVIDTGFDNIKLIKCKFESDDTINGYGSIIDNNIVYQGFKIINSYSGEELANVEKAFAIIGTDGRIVRTPNYGNIQNAIRGFNDSTYALGGNIQKESVTALAGFMHSDITDDVMQLLMQSKKFGEEPERVEIDKKSGYVHVVYDNIGKLICAYTDDIPKGAMAELRFSVVFKDYNLGVTCYIENRVGKEHKILCGLLNRYGEICFINGNDFIKYPTTLRTLKSGGFIPFLYDKEPFKSFGNVSTSLGNSISIAENKEINTQFISDLIYRENVPGPDGEYDTLYSTYKFNVKIPELFGTSIEIGECTSEYLKSGVMLYVRTNKNTYAINGYCATQIRPEFNSNELELLHQFTTPEGNLKTVTFSGGNRYKNDVPNTTSFYNFKKLIESPAVVRFKSYNQYDEEIEYVDYLIGADEITSVDIQQGAKNLNIGTTLTVVAKVNPYNTTKDRSVTWNTSITNDCATVVSTTSDTIELNVVAEGNLGLTATSNYNTDISDTVEYRCIYFVEGINIVYDTNRLEVNGVDVRLTAITTNENASIKEFIWETENGSIINIVERGKDYCVVRAVGIGNCNIICKSTDGSGVIATTLLYAYDKVYMTNLGYSWNTGGIMDVSIGNALIELTYEPNNAYGNLISCEFEKSLRGVDMPYKYNDTMFDNIKIVTCEYSHLLWSYYTSYQYGLYKYKIARYKLIANDGSGLELGYDATSKTETNGNLIGAPDNVPPAVFYTGLIGTTLEERTVYNIKLAVGYSSSVLTLDTNLINSFGSNSVKFEISEGNDIVSLDRFGVAKALAVGKAKITITFKNLVRTINIEVVDVPTSTNASTQFKAVAENGLPVTSNDFGGSLYNVTNDTVYTIVGNTTGFTIDDSTSTVNSGGYKDLVITTTTPNVIQLNEDGTFKVIDSTQIGRLKVTYTDTYKGAERTGRTATVTVNIGATSMNVGEVQSNGGYKTYGKILYAYLNGTNLCTRFATKNTYNEIELVYDKTKAELISEIQTLKGSPSTSTSGVNRNINQFKTLQFTPAINEQGGAITLYQFNKLVDEDVQIQFRLKNNNNINATYTI